ncbi:MAG: CrcB family protein [Vicinamibacterales bacterium]
MGDWKVWVAVWLGSGLGGLFRHALTETVTRLTEGGFPAGTLVVNVAGSAAIGAVAAAVAGGGWSPVGRHAAMTGLLGGFTTFSTFSVQTMALLQQGRWNAALANMVLSVGLSLAGCWAGYAASQHLIR